MYPNAVAKFLFDQSSAHGAFAKDVLNAKEMNVKPGGKQRLMRDTVIPMDNPHPELRGKPQMMVFLFNLPPHHPDFDLRGQAKGMHRVLEEQGLIAVCKRQMAGKLLGSAEPANSHARHRTSSAMRHRLQLKGERSRVRVVLMLCKSPCGQIAACERCLQVSRILRKKGHLSRLSLRRQAMSVGFCLSFIVSSI